jgi:hypothetical protein
MPGGKETSGYSVCGDPLEIWTATPTSSNQTSLPISTGCCQKKISAEAGLSSPPSGDKADEHSLARRVSVQT